MYPLFAAHIIRSLENTRQEIEQLTENTLDREKYLASEVIYCIKSFLNKLIYWTEKIWHMYPADMVRT